MPYDLQDNLPRWFIRIWHFWLTRGEMIKWVLKVFALIMFGYCLHMALCAARVIRPAAVEGLVGRLDTVQARKKSLRTQGE